MVLGRQAQEDEQGDQQGEAKMNASSYCPVRDALDPIANDLKRFAYMDGADIIQELQYSPVGLTAILINTSGKSAPFKRQMGAAVILDNSLTVFDVLRHWLEANGYAAYWDRFAESFVPIIADAQQIQMMIREKLAESSETQNLRWVIGDSLANALAELQGDAADLHKVLMLVNGDLSESLKKQAGDFGEFTELMKWCADNLAEAPKQMDFLALMIRSGGRLQRVREAAESLGYDQSDLRQRFKDRRTEINEKLSGANFGAPWKIVPCTGGVELKPWIWR
jgi:hypothetical protein